MNPTELLSAAASVAGGQHYPDSTLYVVATPIGNRADITLRAVHTLSRVDVVACEDTRTSGQLLQALGLHKPLMALHDHNERQAAEQVVDRLRQGQRVAFISDAGTPAISDPGARLVQAVRRAGFRCIPIPGASSAVAAFSVAGDDQAQGFVFQGFLAHKGAERQSALRGAADNPLAVVLFESPHRIGSLLKDLAQTCPARTVTLARELTKQFEEVHTADAATLPDWLAANAQRQRGEFVVVLHALAMPKTASRLAPPESTEASLAPEAQRLMTVLLQELPVKQASQLAAQYLGLPKRELYAWALSVRKDTDDDA